MQFVNDDIEQTAKKIHRYFRKSEIPMTLDSCETLAKEYMEALEQDRDINGACSEE